MNRNVLFRQSLLSAAVVAVLNSYSVGAVAEACSTDADNDGNVVVAENSNCDGIALSDSALSGGIINNGGILAEDAISLTAGSSVTAINNDESGRLEAHDHGINLDESTAGSIVNSGVINAHNGTGIAIIDSTVTQGIYNARDIFSGVNGIFVGPKKDADGDSVPDTSSAITTRLFNEDKDNAAIFNQGYISGFEAGIRLDDATITFTSGGSNTVNNAAIINDTQAAIDGYFGVRIDAVGAGGADIINRGVIHGSNPFGDVPGLTMPTIPSQVFDDVPIFGPGEDHVHVPGLDHDFGDLLEGPFEIPDFGDDHTDLNIGAGVTGDIFAHAIYSTENSAAVTVTNTETGFIYGRVSGPTLELSNNGKFKTQPGSVIKSYAGSGTLVAVLNSEIAPYNSETPDTVDSVLTAEIITFNDNPSILVDSNYSYKGSPDGNDYVIAYENGGTSNDSIEITNGITVDSASALLGVELVTNHGHADRIIVRVTSKEAGNVLAKFGIPVELQQIMNDFISDVLPELKELDPDNPFVAFLEEASRDEASLLELSEALEPETSGSNTAGATITQSASLGSVSTRTSSSRSGTNTGDLFQDGGVWAQYLHSQGKQDPRAEIDGFDSRLNGITFGVDGDINDRWTLGVALTAADVTTSSTGSSNVTDTSSYIGTLYGSWQNNDRFVDIMASGGISKNETESIVLSDQITSEYDANQLGLRLVTGQDFWLDSQAMVLQPNLSFNYGRVDIEAYQESGSLLAKEYKKQSYEVVELGAGITAMKSFDLDRGVLDTSVALNVYHDFAADQAVIQSRILAAGGNFLPATGAEPEKTTWQASLGINYQVNNTLSTSINYEHTRKSTFAADSASIKLRYDF